jgi:CBS domain-containing protein
LPPGVSLLTGQIGAIGVRIGDMSGEVSAGGVAAAIAEIGTARDEAALMAVVQRAKQQLADDFGRQVPVMTLAGQWSEAIRATVATAARMVAGGPSPQWMSPEWTWCVSGSVGRGDAVPGSDVETLITLDDQVDDAGKAHALILAAQVHTVLERCGLRPDDNGVLASRVRFCRREVSWAEGIRHWTADPEHDRGVVMLGVVADARPLADSRGERLRPQAIAAAQRHAAARKAMLQDATWVRATVPSRLKVFTAHSDHVDLKAALIDPIVKIARWGALSSPSDALSTIQRLSDAAAASVIDDDDAATLQQCYLTLARLRWRRRTTPWLAGIPVDDTVTMADLAPHERATVRTIAREVSGIRRKVAFLASIP